VKIRRAEKIRNGISYDQLQIDPLIEENTGTSYSDELLTFWVSFDIPLTQQTGLYQGNITVDLPEGNDINISVSLNVWDFAIPRKQSFQTSYNLFRQTLRNYYGGQWDDPNSTEYKQWLAFCTDYRVSPIDMSMAESSSHRFVKITRKLDRTWEFDFSLFNAYVDYCYQNGARNFNIGDLKWHFWEPFYGYDEIRQEYREFNLLSWQYEEVFAQYITEASQQYSMSGNRPYEEMAFFYAFDELNPGVPEVLQECTDRHDRVEENWAALNTLTTGEPVRYPAYEGHLDIWCGKIPNYYQYTEPKVDELRAQGDDFWTYVTGYVPPYCNLEINEPGIEHRLIFWQNWVEEIDGFLHWGLNVWPHYRRPNPWVGEMEVEGTYDKWPNRAWNDAGWVTKTYNEGGGYLLYPSPSGPVASIRLEMMRDGLEDWEYINLLDQLIQRAQTEGVSQSIIDNALAAIDVSDTVTGFDTYSSDPAVLSGRRAQIASAIESLVDALGSQKSADYNEDQTVNSSDLADFAETWLETGIDLDTDMNWDEKIDILDLAIFTRVYLLF
jgi:hypothetical protein